MINLDFKAWFTHCISLKTYKSCFSDYLSKRLTPFSKIILFNLLMLPQISMAYNLELFGTISTQIESVDPNTVSDESYTGFRDVYTRIALKLEHDLDNEINVSALIEYPFDTANMSVQHAWDQDRDMLDSVERLAKLQISSPKYGSVWIGMGWEPYWNDISAPIDQFSSYYSGYATYSSLRVDDAIVYSSPNLKGLNFNLLYAHNGGVGNTNGGYDNRNQATISYSIDSAKLAFGYSDMGGANNRQLFGLALSKKAGDFYIATKYERHRSDNSNKQLYGHDGSYAANIYAQYNKGRHAIKAHIAQVDNWGGDVFHVGYDYRLNKSVKLFAEFYSEQTGAAITTERDGFPDTYSDEGGRAVMFGVNFRFSKKIFN